VDDICITSVTVGEYRGTIGLPLPSDTVLYQFIVEGDLYQKIKECAKKWWCENAKAASDPHGYSSGTGGKECPSLHGAIGEVIVASTMYGVENLVQSKAPGKWDYVYEKETHDVKTTGMPHEFWITTSDVRKNQRVRYQMNAAWYVAVHEDSYHLDDGWLAGTVLGRVSRQSVLDNIKITPGKRSRRKLFQHYVRKVPFGLLEPMPTPTKDFLDLIS